MSWHQAKPSFLPLGSKSQLQRANNSLKPSPLRGLGAVWQACTPRRGRKAARLSSGVRPQNQRSGQKSSSRNFLTTGGPPTLEQPRPVSGIAKTRYASAVGCGFTQAKALSVPGLPGQKSIAFSGLTIRSSRDRCAASAKSRRIVTLPWPRSGPA